MQINELPSLGRALQSGDQFAVDDANGITYKVDAGNINPTPATISIPTSRWSGSGSDYYITVTASNVTADSILIPQYDAASAALLNGPVWCVPAAGSFTIHTSAKPSGTVTILVLFPGTMGEAHYEVLADVYSKSQVDSIVAQSTAWVKIAEIITTANTDYDQSVSVSYPSGIKEIMFTLQRNDNGRTFASTVVPFAQFVNGAMYANGTYSLYTGNMSNNNFEFINAVAIYSASSIEIAMKGSIYPIMARILVR